MEPCQIGDIGETILLTELKMRGLSVAIPFGHLDPYDLIAVTKCGKCLKVQVKSSKSPTRGSFTFYKVRNFEMNDIFAFLLLDRWVFMKSSEVKKAVTKMGRLTLNKKTCNFDDYGLFGL